MIFFYALILTLTIETPIYFFVSKKRYTDLLVLLPMNIFTNLVFNLLYVYVSKYSVTFLIIGEVVVFLVETVIFCLYQERLTIKSFFSLLANSASLGISFIHEKYVFPLAPLLDISVYITIIWVVEMLGIIVYISFINLKNS